MIFKQGFLLDLKSNWLKLVSFDSFLNKLSEISDSLIFTNILSLNLSFDRLVFKINLNLGVDF